MKKREDKRQWWQFGGWFNNLPAMDTKAGRARAALQVTATATKDLVKGTLLLCFVLYVVFLVSTPLRPLAVQPPEFLNCFCFKLRVRF